jgi:ADP-ribose pyrophosphatase YjhB (NUDIX family)
LIFRKSRQIRTRVAAVIIRDGRVLLVAHKKNKDIYWLLPGGGVDFGESLEKALQRELREELGITASVGDIALVCDSIDPEQRRHIVNIFFHCTSDDGNYSLGTDGRLHRYCFFSIDEMRDIILFPPIKEELGTMILGGDITRVYLDRKWQDL